MTALPYNKEVITGEDMRESLKKLVSTKVFWGKAAVNKMIFNVDGNVDMPLLHLGDIC